MTNASTRWSHLVRHGLIGTSLLGAAVAPAAAAPCDDDESKVVALVLGLDLSPRVRVVGGVETRVCLDHRSEAMFRFELGGGGAPRLIVGARARPFESSDRYGNREQVGVEGGLAIDSHQRFGMHAAATYGTHSAYVALQTLLPSTSERPTRISILAGLAPWALADDGLVVEGRPLCHGGRFVRPRLAGPRRACASAEERAVRDHFIDVAQLELSSVWTFLRLAQELAAVGAPAALVAAALDAADDEVRHAEMCAKAAGGATLLPLPMEAALPRFAHRSAHALAVLAAEAWREGCLNETAAAEEARLAAGEAEGPARAMLATIASDEDRHAELSWSVLAWALAQDPSLAALTAPSSESAPAERPHFDRALARHGVPSPAITAAARDHARATARSRC